MAGVSLVKRAVIGHIPPGGIPDALLGAHSQNSFATPLSQECVVVQLGEPRDR